LVSLVELLYSRGARQTQKFVFEVQYSEIYLSVTVNFNACIYEIGLTELR
jgi:hypothetical protein